MISAKETEKQAVQLVDNQVSRLCSPDSTKIQTADFVANQREIT